MRRFSFRLQRVMDAKASEERQCQRELGEAQDELGRQQQRMEQLAEEMERQRQRQREMNRTTVTVSQLRLHDQWNGNLKRVVKHQEKEIEKASEEVELRRLKLLEVTREKKVLERLKEKRLEAHNQQLKTEQQNTLDDIGGKMSANSAGGNGLKL